MRVMTVNKYARKDAEGLVVIDGEGVIIYTPEKIKFEEVLSGLKAKLINFSLRNVEPLKDPDRPESEKNTVDIPESELDIDLAPLIIKRQIIVERIDALAHAFIRLAKPFNDGQRVELWRMFYTTVAKEILGVKCPTGE